MLTFEKTEEKTTCEESVITVNDACHDIPLA